MRRAELLAPAGNMEKLEVAFHYGADAVFVGGNMFSLRAGSHNFSNEQLEKAVKYAHDLGKKLYVALNVIPHSNEFEMLPEFVKYLEEIGLDGVIVADLGVFQVVRENSNLSISISTQASNTNWRSVKFWKDLGARRVVLAREVSLENIAEIRKMVPDIEIEVFVHGAMCMAISGRCLLSNHMTSRDANRGDCAQSCRWNYSVYEENMDGDYENTLEEESEESFIFNAKDLCTIEIIDKLLEIGVDSLKIEGRMKGIYYVANVVKVYRDAVDKYYDGDYKFNPEWLRELETTSHRSYSTGFFEHHPDSSAMNYRDRESYSQTHQIVAKVVEKLPNNEYLLQIRNRLEKGDKVEVINRTFGVKELTFPELTVIKKGNETVQDFANPNSIARIKSDIPMEPLDLIRKVTKEKIEATPLEF